MQLEQRLVQTLEDARRTWAAFRPEVAEYLFEQGFRRTAAVLPDGLETDALLEALFRLQMESIGSRAFGVSNDGWRDNPGWPDRYFPLVWLSLVPALMPTLPSERRLPELVALFNLGENLVSVAPSLGGLVAEALCARRDAIVQDGVEPVALEVMVELGIVPASAAPRRRAPRGLRLIAKIPLATWEPDVVPGALSFTAESTLSIADARAPVSLIVGLPAAQLLGRQPVALIPLPRGLPASAGELSITAEGAVVHAGRELGRIDPRGVFGVASSPQGFFAVSRRFSQVVEVWSVA